MKFIIKEISSTRTEIRLSINPVEVGGQFHYIFGTVDGNLDNNSMKSKYIPIDNSLYSSTGPNAGIVRLLVAYLKDFIGSPEASRDYVLTIDASQVKIPIINLAVDDINLITLDSQTIPTILIKLTEELPVEFDILQNINIEKHILTTQEQTIYYIPRTTKEPKFYGLDYDSDAISRVASSDTRKLTYQNYNELTGSLELDDNTVIHQILSQSDDNLKINYGSFENHIYYGSATAKLRNFKTKVKNIENQINLISQSLSSTSSIAINDLRSVAFNKIQQEKSTFTNYERNLYFNSDLQFTNILSMGPNYISNDGALNVENSEKLQNIDGFNLVYKATGSLKSINWFEDKYKVEDKPFYNSSGSFYLSFLIRGDETINGNITWENRNEKYTPKLPFDTLYSSSLLTPNVKSGSWKRHIYHASMSYFAPISTKPVLGYAGSITDFSQGSSEVNVLTTQHKTGSYAITLGSRYTNLATNLTSSGVSFSASIVPTGELFRIGIDASTALTSSFLTDIKITKENPINYKPFMEVFSTGSSNFESWYQQQQDSASFFDEKNIYSFYNNLPQYIIRNTEENFDLETFLAMLGEHFDYIKSHIDNYRYIFNTGYDTTLSTPDKLLPILAKSMGWDFTLPFGKSDDAEIRNFLGSSVSSFNQGTNKTIMNNIWRNVLNHLPFMYKSKGTIRSINTLLNSYGMPSNILKIREHGASLDDFDKSILNNDVSNLLDGLGGSAGNNSFTLKDDKLVSYLIQSSNDQFGLEWGRNDVSADAIEFVFNPKIGTASTTKQTIIVNSGSAGKHLWQLQLEPSGSTQPNKARLKFNLSVGFDGSSGSVVPFSQSLSTSTDYIDLLNGQYYNVLLQKTAGGSGNSYYSSSLNADIAQTYQLLVGKQTADVIDVLSEATLNVTQGDDGTTFAKYASANFVGTGSRAEGTGANLVVGTSYTGSIAEIRAWEQALSASVFKQHILDKQSSIGNSLLSSQNELIYRFKLNENYISGSTNLQFKDSNPNYIKNYTIDVPDLATASLASSPSYLEDEIQRIQFNVKIGGSFELNDNAIIIDAEQSFVENLNPIRPSFMSIYNPLISKRKASSILELVRSPQDVINDFILTQMGNFDFNDKFADPREFYESEYKDLIKFSDDFFNHYDINLNVNKYITAQTNIFNQDLIDSLKRLVPARASFGKIGVELKPTYLYRQKFKNNKLEREIIDISGEIPLTDWETGKYTHTFVGPTEDLIKPYEAKLPISSTTGSGYHTLTAEEYNTENVSLNLINDSGVDDNNMSLKFEEIKLHNSYNTNLDVGVGYKSKSGTSTTFITSETDGRIVFNFVDLVATASVDGFNNSKITFTSADGTQKTYMALSGSSTTITPNTAGTSGTKLIGYNGTSFAVSSSVLFATGSSTSQLAGNFLAAITSSNGHNTPATSEYSFASGAFNNSTIELTSADGTSKTYLALTSSFNGALDSNGNVLFSTGSNEASTLLKMQSGSLAFNLACAISSSNGHNGRLIASSSTDGNLTITQAVGGSQGNTVINYGGHFTGSGFTDNFTGGNTRILVSQTDSEVTLRPHSNIDNAITIDSMTRLFPGHINSTGSFSTKAVAAFPISGTLEAGIRNFAKITLTAADGESKTFMALSSSVGGTYHAVSASVLFNTGSGASAALKARSSVDSLISAIASPAGFGNIGKFKTKDSHTGTGAVLALQQQIGGSVGNTSIVYNDLFTASIYDTSVHGARYFDNPSGEIAPFYLYDRYDEFTSGSDILPIQTEHTSISETKPNGYDVQETGSLTYEMDVVYPYKAKIFSAPDIIDINQYKLDEYHNMQIYEAGVLSIDDNLLEEGYSMHLEHYTTADELKSSLLNLSTDITTPVVGSLLHADNKTFTDWYLRSYEDKDIVASWGTSSSDRHFLQQNEGSEGIFGDHNTYHYDDRQIFKMIGDVEVLSGSYASRQSSFFIDFTGTITNGVHTASKDFSNKSFILSDTGLGLRPLGTTFEFLPTGSISFKGGKFLDETFVYPANHNFLVGSSKDDLDIIYKGSQNNGGLQFTDAENWTDVSGKAFYSITNTGGTTATVNYE